MPARILRQRIPCPPHMPIGLRNVLVGSEVHVLHCVVCQRLQYALILRWNEL